MGDMQGMERQWQLPVLIMANEASASPTFSTCVRVCVTAVCRSLCQSAAKAPLSEKLWLVSDSDQHVLLYTSLLAE